MVGRIVSTIFFRAIRLSSVVRGRTRCVARGRGSPATLAQTMSSRGWRDLSRCTAHDRACGAVRAVLAAGHAVGPAAARRIESRARWDSCSPRPPASCIWIVLWALGYSGLDSGLLALVVMLLGATGRIVLRYLPGGGSAR